MACVFPYLRQRKVVSILKCECENHSFSVLDTLASGSTEFLPPYRTSWEPSNLHHPCIFLPNMLMSNLFFFVKQLQKYYPPKSIIILVVSEISAYAIFKKSWLLFVQFIWICLLSKKKKGENLKCLHTARSFPKALSTQTSVIVLKRSMWWFIVPWILY